MSNVWFKVINEACDRDFVRNEALINLWAFLVAKVNDTICVEDEIFQMSDFFQMNQSKMTEFRLFKINEFPRSKHVYWVILNFRCGSFFVVSWQRD